MVKLANMVVTDWGDGLAISVSSPQLPGIVAAYDTMPDVKEIFQIALDAGLEQDGQIRLFREAVFEAVISARCMCAGPWTKRTRPARMSPVMLSKTVGSTRRSPERSSRTSLVIGTSLWP